MDTEHRIHCKFKGNSDFGKVDKNIDYLKNLSIDVARDYVIVLGVWSFLR